MIKKSRCLLYVSLLALFFSQNIFALVAQKSGKITMLRGKASYIRNSLENPLTKNFILLEGDKVKTSKKSFVRIKMYDDTVFSVGPQSEFLIKEFKYKPGTIRNTVYNIIQGKVRSLINKKAKKDETIQVNTEIVSMGVRGTEILTNAYLVKGNATTDSLLLSGKTETFVSGMKGGVIDLKTGQALNSSKVIMEGADSVTKISPETMKALRANPNAFLPNMQNALGKYINIESVLRSGLKLPPLPTAAGIGAATGAIGLASGLAKGAAGLLAGGSKDHSKEKQEIKNKKSAKKKAGDRLQHKNIIEQSHVIDIAKLPRDIQEAYLNRKQMRKEGTCYYWFYKEIPGYGNKERFRRERDCVDFDYDL